MKFLKKPTKGKKADPKEAKAAMKPTKKAKKK
jgi:hypothetical protein